MATLREIRNRLRSVENIKQITKAMEMVAAARLRRAQMKAEQMNPYAAKLKEMLENLAISHANHPLFLQRPVKKTGIVIIAADKGLCGSYNNNIFLKANKLLKEYKENEVELFVVGQKAINHYQNKKWRIDYQKPMVGEHITLSQIKTLTNQLVNGFLEGLMDEVLLVYTHYINVFSRKVVVEKFLNIGRIESEEKNKHPIAYIFEPSPTKIYAEILPRYCLTKIQHIFYEAYASELAARIVSMKTAHKNADDLINKLTLTRNKVRQASITKEMLEITSGAEGLK